jgi:general secretion pathway protein I
MSRRAFRPSRARGFTLIEVLVAIAILGLGLTAILAAQAGTFASVDHARNISQANGLLRCKMSEVEADLQQNGYVVDDTNDSGPCCDHTDDIRMTCNWRVERATFPEPKLGDLDLDTDLDLGSESGSSSSPGNFSTLMNASKGKLELPQGGNVGEMADALAQGGGSIADSATGMMMGIVYPDLKQIFENGTRRITVTITWTEGKKEYTSELQQWVSNGRAAGITGELPGQDLDSQPDPTSSTGSGTPSSGGNPFAPKAPRMER